jgi:hypothetical protein
VEGLLQDQFRVRLRRKAEMFVVCWCIVVDLKERRKLGPEISIN